MAGHGVILSDAYAELRELAERTGIPVITTLLGISAFPESHPLHLGMPGMHGEVHVNRAIQQADLIIGMGLRFDDRVTGNLAGLRAGREGHPHRARPVRDREERAGRGRPGGRRARHALRAARSASSRATATAGGPRSRASCGRAWRASRAGCPPTAILARASRTRTAGRCTIVSDVGQHQMWVAKLFRYQRPNTHITSGGLGTMGFAVPAAMGVALARPGEPVWAISGDGGFQMNMQEIATMVQEGIPVKMAIFNNGYLGMVRQWQQFFHGRRYSATPIWSPDYVAPGRGVRHPGLAGRARRTRWTAWCAPRWRTPGPALVEFLIEQEANVFPMIPPGGVALRADRGGAGHAHWSRHDARVSRDGPARGPSHHVQPCRRTDPAAKPARAEHRRGTHGRPRASRD